MNSFVFQNSTKVYFGNDSVSTYLPGLLAQYGPKVMLTYGCLLYTSSAMASLFVSLMRKCVLPLMPFFGR